MKCIRDDYECISVPNDYNCGKCWDAWVYKNRWKYIRKYLYWMIFAIFIYAFSFCFIILFQAEMGLQQKSTSKCYKQYQDKVLKYFRRGE